MAQRKPTRGSHLPALPEDAQVPPILAGQATKAVRERVGRFFVSVAEIFERWVHRRESPHTQRAYRGDVMACVRFLGIRWPEESFRMLSVAAVSDVSQSRFRAASYPSFCPSGHGFAPRFLQTSPHDDALALR